MATHHSQPLLHPPKTKSSPAHMMKTICLVLSVVAIISSTALIASYLTKLKPSNLSLPHQICERAHEPASCLALLSELVQNTTLQTKYQTDLLQAFLEETNAHIQKAKQATKAIKYRINDPTQQLALDDCHELLDSSIDRVLDSVVALTYTSMEAHQDAHAWLSAVLTNHVTCSDGLKGSALSLMESHLKNLISRARTSLAMLVAISKPNPDEGMESLKSVDVPSWVSSNDRKLLQLGAGQINADVVVAKDGSGRFKTLKEAVNSAPVNSKARYVIYVKKGIYKENVEIVKNKINLMITGDGKDLTVITGSLNVVDGSTTFKSATIAAAGDGFIAQDIWIQNTAGPQKHQAVALRVSADKAVINRCRIDAYQDTLYTHTLRQFYRDSFITGTVDFIFGNAAVVLQNCDLVARKPMNGQNNMVTAQGREDPNQATGTSIQNCNIKASSDLQPAKGSTKTYLGRPWKQYSRTMVMQSFIDDHVDPTGWAPWDKDFALNTLYYAEYKNRGPGAGTRGRVKWGGYHVVTNPEEAKAFTVAGLIQGGMWLKSTGVAFTEGL